MTELLIVLSNPIDQDHDAEYNAWYDATHLEEVTSVPGIVRARRYRLENDGVGQKPSEHRYLAIYELEGDAGPAIAEMKRRAASGEIAVSPTLDRANSAAWLFSLLSEWPPPGS
jgi:hypothetical protein